MASRTVQDILAAVHRKCSGLVPVSDIYQALLNVHRQVYASHSWPWTYAEANISVAAPYTTGTISITDGTAAVVGLGTTWSTGWLYKKLHFTVGADYEISSFGSTTTCTLKETINTGADWAAASYTIYQEDYPLPDDCEPGDVVLVINPNYRYRLMNPPRGTQEMIGMPMGITFPSLQTSWTDGGYNETTKKYLIKFSPPCGAVAEYRIVYRRRMTQFAALTDTSSIPETFDMALEHLAEYEVKRSHPREFPTSEADRAKAEGYQVLQNMRRRITSSGYDIVSSYAGWPFLSGSSMVDRSTGLIIEGPVTEA